MAAEQKSNGHYHAQRPVPYRREDLPEAWLAPVPAETLSAVTQQSGKAEVQNQVAVEVPELEPFLLWQRHCLTADGSLPVLVSNREDFKRSRGGDVAIRDSLRHLFEHGRPSPLFVRIFY